MHAKEGSVEGRKLDEGNIIYSSGNRTTPYHYMDTVINHRKLIIKLLLVQVLEKIFKFDSMPFITNAQECRTLTATCMHNIAWLTVHVCMCNTSIRSIELRILHLNSLTESVWYY